MRSVLFASNHCYLDYASGATVAMRDLFHFLTAAGHTCKVFCGSAVDGAVPIKKLFDARSLYPHTQTCDSAQTKFSLHSLTNDGVDIQIYDPGIYTESLSPAHGLPYLQLLDRYLVIHRPDVLLTFGGNWLGRALIAVAQRHGIPVIFWLRNTYYEQRDLFDGVDGFLVPCHFTADHYRKTLGLGCRVVYSPIRPERVICPIREPKFATYISPNPDKGVFYFARIASELGRLRPDIPLQIVVGRGDARWLDQTGLNLRSLPNLHVMPATVDPREFLQTSRVILAPSLWQETFLRIGAEGILNGIPTLASRLGGIPETLGSSGFLFDIAAHHTPKSRHVPNVAEVRPWIDTLAKLWDDEAFYRQQSTLCLTEAPRFAPELITRQHSEYIEEISRRARPANLRNPLRNDLDFLARYFSGPID